MPLGSWPHWQERKKYLCPQGPGHTGRSGRNSQCPQGLGHTGRRGRNSQCPQGLGHTGLRVYKIRCYPVHPPNGALPGPYVPARVTRGALVAHRYTHASPRCRTLQYSRTFIPFLVSLCNDLANPVFDFLGLALSILTTKRTKTFSQHDCERMLNLMNGCYVNGCIINGRVYRTLTEWSSILD